MRNILAAQIRVGGVTGSPRAGAARPTVLWSGRLLLLFALFVLASGSLCHRPIVHHGFECITPDDSLSFEPCIACNANGHVVLAWTRNLSGKEDIWFVEKDSGGDWSEPVNLSQSGTGYGSRSISLCFDQTGTLHAAWSQALEFGWVILYTWRQAGGGWAVPETVRLGLPIYPHIGVAASGYVHLFFQDASGAGSNPCYATRAPSGEWSQVTELRSGYLCRDLAPFMHQDGRCIVAYVERDSAHALGRVHWLSGSGDAWSAPALLDSLSNAPVFVQMTGMGGTSYLGYVWLGKIRVWSQVESSGWRGPDTLCPRNGAPAMISLAPLAVSDLIAAWSDAHSLEMMLARRASAWSETVVVAGSDSTNPWHTSLTIAPDGLIHLVWAGGDPEHSKVFYTSLRIE